MSKIDLNKYPKIAQMHPSVGCIPVNIENALKKMMKGIIIS